MLTMNDSNMNFNAISQDTQTQATIASMSASYSGGTGVYFSINIDDYNADLNDMKTDFNDFITKVISSVKKVKE